MPERNQFKLGMWSRSLATCMAWASCPHGDGSSLSLCWGHPFKGLVFPLSFF